jgi:hypothetical protein
MEKNFDKNLVYGFFRQHPLVTLSTVSEAGVPQNAAVYIYMDDDMNCYCVTRQNTRKFRNVEANTIATISAYDENVLMFGELQCIAKPLTNPEEISVVMPELQKIIFSRKSDYWVPPVAQLEGEGYVFIKLEPQKALFSNYEQSSAENPKPHRVELDF